MKISLLTIWHIENYGAELQTYATVKALQQLGHEVEVIDFRLTDGAHKSIEAKLLDFIVKFSPNHRNFVRFWRNFIPSSKHYKSSSDLYNYLFDSDLFVVGSDQVWNPDITKDKCLIFFLDFVSKGIRKAAYASSFGVGKWKYSLERTETIKTLLNDFDSVSCRESHGVKILDQVFNMTAEHVLDPTLLFASYTELINEQKQNNSLVLYSLSQDSALRSFAAGIACHLHLKLIDNNTRSKILNRRAWSRPSIHQWLQNIHDSRFVVTDSYHGTIFSILYHKPFVTIYNGTKSSRIESLLNILGLNDRFFSSIYDAMNSNICEKKIDYSVVDEKLNVFRVRSWDFLRRVTEES